MMLSDDNPYTPPQQQHRVDERSPQVSRRCAWLMVILPPIVSVGTWKCGFYYVDVIGSYGGDWRGASVAALFLTGLVTLCGLYVMIHGVRRLLS